jgi:hypothetical protein
MKIMEICNMSSYNLVITTSNFESFVTSLKSNLKLGYGQCVSTEYIHGFFRCVLAKGVDEGYIASLNALTGKERENVIDLMCSLSDKSTVSVNVDVPANQTPQPRTKDTVKPHYLSQEVLDRVAKECTERNFEVGAPLEPIKKPRKTRTKKGE